MSVPIRAQIKPQIKPDAATNDLWRIAEIGRTERLEQVLARGADINVSNASGVTPLMVAAYNGRLPMVRALIEHGANLNAVDCDGFTAVMLAEHSGHEDIVKTLMAFGTKGLPGPPAPDASPMRFAQDETFDTPRDPDVPPMRRIPEVRTLHDPPEIWDLVHETPTEFHPQSAFVARLTSANPLVLAAIALIIGGGAVFGFMKLRGRSVSAPAAPAVRAENSNTKTASSSQATVPNTTASPAQQPNNTPVSTDIAGSGVEPNIAVAPSAALSGRRVVAKAPRQNSTSSGNTGRLATAGTVNKDRAQQSMTLGAKSDNEKRGDPTVPTVAKKESDKAPSPQLIAPAKSSPSPGAKVIKWP